MKVTLKDLLFQKKPSEINPMIDEEMDEIVLKAVSHDVEKRYPTCREFLKDLESYTDHNLRKVME